MIIMNWTNYPRILRINLKILKTNPSTVYSLYNGSVRRLAAKYSLQRKSAIEGPLLLQKMKFGLKRRYRGRILYFLRFSRLNIGVLRFVLGILRFVLGILRFVLGILRFVPRNPLV